jgi:uncharacterized cupredoxin-like copper-binding protein
MKLYIINIFIILLINILYNSHSADLTRQKEIEKIVLLKGEQGKIHFYEPNELVFNTGKLYKLIIKNESDSKHYFTSTLFAKSIFTRKVQVSLNNKKVAEIKGIINTVEVWPNHQLEWWFVPIKTGVFKDLYCNVKDTKTNLSHANMGMTGTIIIN